MSVPVETASARRLAELHGIHQDLEIVVQLCDRLPKTLDDLRKGDTLVLEAVFVAAVIRYCRCFNSGVRPILFEEIKAKYSSDQLEFHEFVCDLRSKFVAHSVNVFDDNQVTVAVPKDPPKDFKPEHLGFFHGRPLMLGTGIDSDLSEMAKWVLGEVDQLIDLEKAKVLAEVQAIPARELASAGVVRPRLAAMKEVKKPRVKA